jgi:hypothetical protein
MFDKTEWDRLVGWVKCLWSGDSPIKSACRYSDAFRDAREWDHRIAQVEKRLDLDDDAICAEVFDRAVHYWQIANRIAWSVNYTTRQVNPVPADEEHAADLESAVLVLADYRKIRAELTHIRYNLATNGGNVFLPEPYAKLLDGVINGLAEHLVRATAPDRYAQAGGGAA